MLLRVFRSLTIIVILISIQYKDGVTQPAQDSGGKIRGVVIDYATKEPLMSANVFIPSLNIGTSTDKDGKFVLLLKAPVKTMVEISFVGYEKKEIEIDISEGDDKEFIVYLNTGGLETGYVMVTGSKMTETIFNSTNFVSVTTEEEIKTSHYTTTADVLKKEPGILIQKTTHAHGAPVIRGLIGKYVLLLYNGVRLNKPTFRFGANQYLNTVNPEALNHIEITRGPTSVLYGSDAIGGTINLVTERYVPDSDEMKIVPEMLFGYSSADESKSGALYLKGGKGKMSFSGSLLYKDVNNLDPGGDEKRQNPTGWEEFNGNLSLFYTPSAKHHFDINYINVNQKNVPRYDKYVTGEYQNWTYNPQKRRLYALFYTYAPSLSWLHLLKWNVSYQDENEGRTLQKTNKSLITTESDNIKTFGTFVNLSSILNQKHWLNWGFEYYRDKVNSDRLRQDNGISTEERGAFPDGSIYNSFGVYIQDNFQVTNRFELSGGLRYSRYSFNTRLEEPFGLYKDDFDNVTGFGGVRYKVRPGVNIVGSIARGFRAPNFNDTIVLQVSNSGVDAPSPNLVPEISQNFELGIKVEQEQLNGGWFVYYNRMSDLIDRRLGLYQGLAFFDDNGNGVNDPEETTRIWQKFNVDKAKIYGTELFASYRINSLLFSGQTFFTYGENTTENEPMSRIPPLTGQLGVRWDVADRGYVETDVWFAAKQDRLSQRDVEDSRIPAGGTPGYSTFSLKGVYAFSTGRIVLTFENIFDELYKTHGSGIFSPGRHIAFSYQITSFSANP